jgi:hypothetical protein
VQNLENQQNTFWTCGFAEGKNCSPALFILKINKKIGTASGATLRIGISKKDIWT